MMNFSLDLIQIEKYTEWHAKQIQKESHIPTLGERFEFCFTPTSLGMVVVVKDGFLQEEIDLTDYDNW